MSINKLYKETVLVLNKNWQAVHVYNPADALSEMFNGGVIGLHIDCKTGDMIPLKWKDWVALPFDESSDYISTVHGKIKYPRVVILKSFAQVPKRKIKFSLRGIWDRDKNICAYTGVKLTSKTGNVDHIIPRSRGGRTTWKNCVLSHKDVNAKKADKTPSEAGLQLLRSPAEPMAVPATMTIKNKHNIPEWKMVLEYDGYVKAD
jgi:hypothetical protein